MAASKPAVKSLYTGSGPVVMGDAITLHTTGDITKNTGFSCRPLPRRGSSRARFGHEFLPLPGNFRFPGRPGLPGGLLKKPLLQRTCRRRPNAGGRGVASDSTKETIPGGPSRKRAKEDTGTSFLRLVEARGRAARVNHSPWPSRYGRYSALPR